MSGILRPLLTPTEAAKLLNISTKQLLFLTQDGEIQYINVGLGKERERRRYHPDDIEDFIARRRTVGGRSSKPSLRSYYPIYDIKKIRASLKGQRGRKT